MGKTKRIGCGCCCLPVILLAVLQIWQLCKSRVYEFELRIFDKVPDLNQYSVICTRTYFRDHEWWFHNMLYGYGLYHDAMRENGIGSLILTDELLREAGTFFEGAQGRPSRIPWEGGASYFGCLPAMEFLGHSNVVDSIQNTAACYNALQSIETNAVLNCQWGFSDVPYSFEVVDYIGECAGVGRVEYDESGRGVTTEENAKKCAKEAITACAIKTAFPGLRTPRIDEDAPIMEMRWFWHGRAPILCRINVVATRTFKFYDDDGCLFASLRINVEYDNPSGWNLKGYDEIYKAIFKEAFKELKASKGAVVVSGKSHYDEGGGVGVISDLKRDKGAEPVDTPALTR